MIKSYKDFIVEMSINRFGFVMLDLEITNWSEITKKIDKSDIYSEEKDSFGIENEPHITVFYGLHSSVDDENIISIINKYKYENYYDIKINKVDSFKNQNYDVLKYSIQMDNSLKEFNNQLSKLPNSNEFPDYNPHITIAYLLPGLSEKYYNDIPLPSDLRVNCIKYSKANGQKLIYNVY